LNPESILTSGGPTFSHCAIPFSITRLLLYPPLLFAYSGGAPPDPFFPSLLDPPLIFVKLILFLMGPATHPPPGPPFFPSPSPCDRLSRASPQVSPFFLFSFQNQMSTFRSTSKPITVPPCGLTFCLFLNSPFHNSFFYPNIFSVLPSWLSGNSVRSSLPASPLFYRRSFLF